MKRRLIQNIVVVVLGTFMIAACSEVEEQHDFAGKNIPIEFDFSFANESGTTRSTSLATNKTVYVFDGTSYYPYKYVFDNDRWECDSDEPLTWKGAQMPLWAFVRNDNEIMSSTNMLTNIQPDQARYGIEGSDFLACVDTYDFSTGIIKMTLYGLVTLPK